jgi:HSP20 family protein
MLTRWSPFSEMRSIREAIGRLFDEAFVLPSIFANRTGAVLPYDLAESRDAIILRVALPGVDPNTVDLSVQGEVLTLRAQRRPYGTDEAAQYTWYTRSLPEGEVTLAVALPVEVDADAAEASFEAGILTVHLPKAQAVRPKTIPIKAAPVREALPAGS